MECGADLVKSQAYIAENVAQNGSMPRSFYEQCEFTLDQYKELIEYARSIGTDLFYSIFDPSLSDLYLIQKYMKISRPQFLTWEEQEIIIHDYPTTFISMPDDTKTLYLEKANVLYVNAYNNTNDDLHMIDVLANTYRNVGLSDHSIGPTTCIKAIQHFGVTNIETHFTLKKDMEFHNQIYRDTVHGKDPQEFELIAKELKR